MSSIVGHGLAGMSLWALARRRPELRDFEHRGWFAAAAAASVLPDVDSLIGLSHRGVTHTLAFAAGVSAAVVGVTALLMRRRPAGALGIVLALILWLHPVMDLLSGGGPPVRLFWPLLGVALTPVRGGLPLHGFTTEWTDLVGLLLNPWTLRGIFIEAVIFGPLFGAAVLERKAWRLALAAVGALAWAGGAVLVV